MKIRRVDFSPDEWLSGANELSLQDRGLYITICSLIYSRGGRIHEELIFRNCHEHGNAIRAALARLERAGKIIRNGSEIGQKRSENELENARKRSAIASENISKRWNNNHVGTETVLPRGNANHQPSSTNKKENQHLAVLSKESDIFATAAKPARRSQIPPDWLPDEAGFAYASDKATWSRERATEEAAHFRDHHRSKADLFADHGAAWRTWVRNGAKFQANGKAGNGKMPTPSQSDTARYGYNPALGDIVNPPLKQRRSETTEEFIARRDHDAQIRSSLPYSIRPT